MKYRAEIDGLRALAVLPVILFHAGFDWFSGGFIGVDVFFVISGYLITTIIINEMAEGKFSIVNFYERRARRILGEGGLKKKGENQSCEHARLRVVHCQPSPAAAAAQAKARRSRLAMKS